MEKQDIIMIEKEKRLSLDLLYDVMYGNRNIGEVDQAYEELKKAINTQSKRLAKVEELLGLYREHHKLVPFKTGLGDKSKRVCDISIEIKQKEKELEELK